MIPFTTHGPLLDANAWQSHFIHRTHNGKLLCANALFDRVNQGHDFILIHASADAGAVVRSGQLLASEGCLGASVYASPLRADGTLHNLSSFLWSDELPRSLRARNRVGDPGLFAIRVPYTPLAQNRWIGGVDYLSLGLLNARALCRFGCERKEALFHVLDTAYTQTEQGAPFLEYCHSPHAYGVSDFESLLWRSARRMPSLGYFLFEALQEFVLLHQDDLISREHFCRGEFYNAHFKRMVFDLCPELLAGFKLVLFNPPLDRVAKYLKEKSEEGIILSNFDVSYFNDFISQRVLFLVREKLLDGRPPPHMDGPLALLQGPPSLAGHLSYRGIREEDWLEATLKEEYLSQRSHTLWGLLNDLHIGIPYNAIIPKGEVGINPCASLPHTIHRADVDAVTGKVRMGKPLEVALSTRVVRPFQCAMC